MLTVYNCLVDEHDLRLVVLAALVCAIASFAALSLLHHVRRSTGYMRAVWLTVSAISTGFGIWATHFVAMLAYSPAIQNAYSVPLTSLSLVAAIVLTGVGLAVAVSSKFRGGTWIGGGLVGGGIAVMHYTGMAAFEVQGRIIWDLPLVTASIVLGAVIGAAALPVGLRADSLKWKLSGALLLTLAICSHHFTAMGAASLIPDPTISISDTALPSGWLAIAVAVASAIILMLALAGVALEMRDRRRGELENARMRGLANAAIEGLVVCEGDKIITVNDSFSALAGRPAGAIVGTNLEQHFAEEVIRLRLWDRPNNAVEG
ncbi:MAG TPA: MHYT domain-containing protein, partial [Pseudolabrys sp.]|nr:MHYT domain-containing protein [Pseudolabrys sp.]